MARKPQVQQEQVEVQSEVQPEAETSQPSISQEQILKIETYSLFEFCQKVQEAIQEGWVFDFESNENFPTAFGSLIVAGLKK